MPVAPVLKREGSEASSLSSILAAESQPTSAARGGSLNSRRASQREIDLSSLAHDPSGKVKKQAKIDSELKDAIAALKKPNRELAGKSFAETVEQRVVSAPHPRSKFIFSYVIFRANERTESKKPIRNPLFQGVQISATPRANRQMDMFGRSQVPGLSEPIDFGTVPSSSAKMIPQSSLPSQARKSQKNPFLSIEATPTRKTLSVPRPFMDGHSPIGGAFPPSSPIQMRRSSASLFPVIPVIPESAVKPTSKPSMLQETPVKKRPNCVIQHSHPPPVVSGAKEEISENPFLLQETPVKKRPGQPPLALGDREEEAETRFLLQETPVKRRPDHAPLASGDDKENSQLGKSTVHKAKIEVQSQSQEKSIYTALGWDDDFDELA